MGAWKLEFGTLLMVLASWHLEGVLSSFLETGVLLVLVGPRPAKTLLNQLPYHRSLQLKLNVHHD